MLQPVATGSCNRFLQPVATGPCNRSLQRSTTGCNRFLQQAATQESPSVASTVRSVHSRSRGLRSGTATHGASRGDLFANRMHAVARCHGAFGTHLVCLLCAVCVCECVCVCVCVCCRVLPCVAVCCRVCVISLKFWALVWKRVLGRMLHTRALLLLRCRCVARLAEALTRERADGAADERAGEVVQ
jgi:hypothetical protein